MGVFMRRINKLILIITMLVSASGLFAIDYYDKKEEIVQKLYDKINLSEITYTQIAIQIKAMKQKEYLDDRALISKSQNMAYELAHHPECSKLCTQIHTVSSELEHIQDKQSMAILMRGEEETSHYDFLVKTQKDASYSTYYNMQIQGINESMLDHLRERTIKRFKFWGLKTSEYISFRGVINGNLSHQKREELVGRLLKQLSANQTDFYQEDIYQDTQAYYGYTPLFSSYILDNNRQKTNLQISFCYNEVLDETSLIIAFPFYNEVF